jgi:hypothetical protein
MLLVTFLWSGLADRPAHGAGGRPALHRHVRRGLRGHRAGGGAAQPQAMALFQAGRWLGYSALGALAAASMQGLGWLTVQSAALRPVWTMVHVAAVLLGLAADGSGAPAGLAGRRRAARLGAGACATQSLGSLVAPLGLGVAWALAAVRLAVLGAAGGGAGRRGGRRGRHGLVCRGHQRVAGGGAVAAAAAGPVVDGAWSMRVAGLALIADLGLGLWMGLVHDQAPWCVVPVP